MEKIKNYLDTMFSNFPKTEEVEKAKSELYQMMEDKYTELVDEGKSENEILGIIIGEFGNVSELAEEFGIDMNAKRPKQKVKKEFRFYNIHLEDAKTYINHAMWSALRKSLAIFLFILGGVSLYIGESFNKVMGIRENENYIGLIVQLLIAILGIGIFVLDTRKMRKWEKIKTGICRLDEGVYMWVYEHRKNTMFIRTIGIITGYAISVASVAAVILSKTYTIGMISIDRRSIAGSLVFASIGVFILVLCNYINKYYKTLMAWEDATEKDGNYYVGYKVIFVEKIMSAYWETVLAIYLMISFITFCFELTWIILPVACIINTIIDKFFEKE